MPESQSITIPKAYEVFSEPPTTQHVDDKGGELAVRKFLSRVDSKVARASEDKKKQDRRTQATSKIALAAANALAKHLEKRQRKWQEQEKFRRDVEKTKQKSRHFADRAFSAWVGCGLPLGHCSFSILHPRRAWLDRCVGVAQCFYPQLLSGTGLS